MNPVPIMHKDGEQNKKINAIKSYQKYMYKFCYKGNVLAEPMKVLHRSQFECHTFINAVLMVNEWNVSIEHWWDDVDGKGKSTWRKTCCSATLSTINLTWASDWTRAPALTWRQLSKLTWAKRASWWKIHSKFDYIWNIFLYCDYQCSLVEKISCIWRIRSQGLR